MAHQEPSFFPTTASSRDASPAFRARGPSWVLGGYRPPRANGTLICRKLRSDGFRSRGRPQARRATPRRSQTPRSLRDVVGASRRPGGSPGAEPNVKGLYLGQRVLGAIGHAATRESSGFVGASAWWMSHLLFSPCKVDRALGASRRPGVSRDPRQKGPTV